MKRNFESIKLDDDEDDDVLIVSSYKRDQQNPASQQTTTSLTSATPATSSTITTITTSIPKTITITLGSSLKAPSSATNTLPGPSGLSHPPFRPVQVFAGPSSIRSGLMSFNPGSSASSPKSSFLINSIRMGPPYPSGIRNRIPVRPPVQKFQPGPARPLSFRHRFFNPQETSQPYVSTIDLLDTDSSGGPSTDHSSDGEDDNASTSSNTNDAPPESTQSKKSTLIDSSKKASPDQKTKSSGMRSSASSKIIEPIIIEDSPPSSPSYSPECSPPHTSEDQVKPTQNKKVKVGMGITYGAQAEPQVDAISKETERMLQNLLPSEESGENDEELSNLLKTGMNMIDPEDLLQKMKQLPNDKPKRLYIKGLYSQAKHGNIPRVLSFLYGGTNPCGIVKNEEGKTPLHIAASKGHLEILLLLLYKAGKGKVNVQDHHNRTPLYMAVDKNHMKVAEFLVKGGANIFCQTTEGTNLLHVASRRGNLLAVKWLIKLGVPANQQDNFGWTALMWCAESDNNSCIIRYLIKQGALTNLLDNEMNICLHWSAIAGSFECARELVSGSSDPQINAKNKFGETPLHVAAKGDHFNVAQFLLLNGADPNIKNKQNCTALDVCPSSSKTFHCIRIRTEVGQEKIKPYMYLSDISMGKEKIPVSCLNEVDDESFPQDFIYVVHPEESKNVSVKRGFSTVSPCKCSGTCTAECKCVILSEKNKLWYSEDGILDVSIFDEESPVLYECTPLCSCWSYCPNRVAQKGIRFPLQVFKTRTKGWGLRTLTPITQGSFILSYIGELITDEEAEKREDTYLFNLDLKTSGDEPNCMDALRIGNCGRFINHSCDANMKAVKLFTHHRDVSFPEVAFFACVDIQGKEELCFNYGDTFWDVKNENGQYCKCMSENCQYRRP
ncbi:histone-lysine N-methyltransferase EHMT2-like [Clytia hemisphaerica]